MRTVLSRLSSIRARGASPGIWPLLAAACLASALGAQAAAPRGAGADLARLESIAGAFDRQADSILIRTSEPVPYLTADPDPTTVLVELRNVTSTGVDNRLASGGGGAVSGVAVEDGTSADGAPVTRVRVRLAQPYEHRVRSARNVIRVEVDRRALSAAETNRAQTAPGTTTRKPATVLNSLRAMHGPGGPIIVLQGNGALAPTSIELTKQTPYRLVLDFAGVSPGVKPTTPVGTDPVDRVRVARHSSDPLVTRVVVDLNRSVAYRIDESQGGIAIVFGTPAAPTLAVTPAVEAAKPAADAQPAVAAAPGTAQTPPAQDTTDLLRRLRAVQAQNPPAAGEPPAAAARVQPPTAASATPPVKPPAEPATPSAQPVTPPAPPATPPAQAVTPPAPPVTPPAQPAPKPLAQAAVTPAAQLATIGQQPPSRPQPTEPAGPQPSILRPSASQELQAQQSQQVEKKYQGAPISLDFAGADIRQVLRVFSDQSGLNIIIDPKVQGSVDISLRDVPWDQAMEIILKSANLGYALDGNVVRIASLTTLAEEEKQRRALDEEKALSGQLDTLTRTLSYATARDMSNVIRNSGLTKRGQIQTDDRTNTLIIRDLPQALPGIAQIIDTLDKPQPQVEIEARIVQTTRAFARQLGIKWGFLGQMTPALGNTTGLAFPNSVSAGGVTAGTTTTGMVPVVNLPAPGNATSAIGLSMGAVNGAFNLDIELTALETQGKGRVLSSPRVLAQNNFQAEMTQGVQIPIQTVANNTVTVTFKDAALKLLVTPQVTATQTVIMNIQLENATPNWARSVNNIPPIDTQRAVTQVMTSDNQTVVIGGVFVSQEQTTNDHTPGLSRIPLLGWLFKRDTIDDQTNELLIFLTPRIVK